MAEMLKIILENVEHFYEDRKVNRIHALGGVTFSVQKGEFISIVGASGTGKTTILNIIAGFINPTKGRVLVDGKEIKGPGNDRIVIFQEDAVFPWYTVEENIRYGLRWLSLSPNEVKERVERFLEAVGLTHRRSSYPKYLSGGERKRVELARTFAVFPEIILADEPFKDLDALTKGQLQELLLSLWRKESNTIVIATHDIEEALLLSDRIVILSSPPAKIKQIVDVPFPRPRKLSIRNQPDFVNLRVKIESLLKIESLFLENEVIRNGTK